MIKTFLNFTKTLAFLKINTWGKLTSHLFWIHNSDSSSTYLYSLVNTLFVFEKSFQFLNGNIPSPIDAPQ